MTVTTTHTIAPGVTVVVRDKTPVPLSDDRLVVSTKMLADPHAYQPSCQQS